MALIPLTSEQMAAVRAKAIQARQAKAALKAATKHLLKQRYLDASHWAELASKHVIRMPSNEEAVDESTITRYLKRTGVPRDVWNDHYTSASYFVQNHPTWTKYAVAGLILELKEEYKL